MASDTMSIDVDNIIAEENQCQIQEIDPRNIESYESASSLSSAFYKHDYQDSETEAISYPLLTAPLVPPDVSGKHIPIVGREYASIDEAQDVYKKYAEKAGFTVMLASANLYGDKTIQKKYVRCDRYGKPPARKVNVIEEEGVERKHRKGWSKKTGCLAMMCIHRDIKTNMFRISAFQPLHNHELVRKDYDAECSKKNKLSFMDKHFIMKLSTLNIGPSKAYKLRSCLKGGYNNINTSKSAFTNFWRDYTSILGPYDAQFVVDQLTIRKNSYPNFFFKHKVNGKVLEALFWVDELAQDSYSIFSDVISVDATYRSNRYKMVFVPFTAVNNHEKTINVGAALLSDETIDSYSWMLERFLEAHGKPPGIILTDQDPALSQAIKRAMPNTTHRLCMWHIMNKMPKKIAEDVLVDTCFRKHITKLVWNIHLDTVEFENRWDLMLSEFKLRENKWLHDMYLIRDRWIPAYFKHLPMCGLMKTTSRSECSNSFFNAFSNNHNLLVNFMFNFDTALTKQRYDQQQDDVLSNTKIAALVTDKYNERIEIHAAKVYTREVFTRIQKELRKAQSLCSQHSFIESEDKNIHTIVYRNQKMNLKTRFEVTVKFNLKSTECTCQRFEQFGIICCHIFRVFFDNGISHIPDKYIAQRWRRNVVNMSSKTVKFQSGVFNSEISKAAEESMAQFERCLEKVVHDTDKIQDLTDKLKDIELGYAEDSSNKKIIVQNKDFVEEIVGLKLGKSIEIDAPSGIKNKGGNRQTRLLSSKEKAVAKANRSKRECQGCHLLVHHDIRNCPANPSKKLKPIKKIRKR